jgi:hypothetical protein
MCSVSGSHSAIGTYTIGCSGGLDDHYSFTFIDGTLSVVRNQANVFIGAGLQHSYAIDPVDDIRDGYIGINNGPLRTQSVYGIELIPSIKVLFGGVSYSEMLGLPSGQVAKEYWFPVYDSSGSLNSQLRVGNVENQATTITVYLGSNPTPLDSFTLGANAALRKNYTGINDGPLHVVSSVTNVLTSVRYLYGANSYSEELGYPGNQLTTEYYFPWYNNFAFASELRVANTGNAAANVEVYVGTNLTPLDSFPIAIGGNVRKSYASLNNGPLRVVTSTSTIVSSIKVLYKTSSYSEMLGLPTAKLTNEYWMPVYDSATNNSQIRIGNVGNQATQITIYAGSSSIPLDQFTLNANAAVRKNYSGTNTGPLHIVSSTTNVLVSVRELYTTASFESYYELLAYPDSLLTTQYFFPWYNNVAFPSELRIGVP